MTADEQMPCRRFKLNMQCKLFRFHMNPCVAAANVLLEKHAWTVSMQKYASHVVEWKPQATSHMVFLSALIALITCPLNDL